MKEIFVVTHPEATHHVEGRVGGWFDSELTGRGVEQAQRIAAALAKRVQPGAALYSSDLRRTAQTAAAIGAQLELEPVWLTELREKTYGAGEGKHDAWFRERFVPPPPDGERMDHDEGLEGAETKLQWARRVYAGVEKILSDSPRQKIIVTHGGSATLVIARWIEMPLDALTHASFKVDSGSITRLVEDDYFHNHTVAHLNDTTHLSS
ncbi:histidine phosphatase family protein [Microbacterium sp. CFBP 8794]|uniref:histidine phosphatase family protein n=1 Tax=Microbacterium sp. CFBP 8794 TaxID=2775269 RepID=UPI001780D001|nr:histidine phosphatase family protein [Microbacterium sp. CFBP 8794]